MGIRVISSLFFFFFYEKLLHAQKAQNAYKRPSPHQKFLCAQKNAVVGALFACLRFVSLSLLVSGFLLASGFFLVVGFYA